MKIAASPRLRGFTIVELLVVISIIALLVSMLLPTFHNAKALATNLLCMSNQRGFAQVCSSYAVDFKVLPPACPIGQWNQATGGYDGAQLTPLLNGGYPSPDLITMRNNSARMDEYGNYFLTRPDDKPGALLATCCDPEWNHNGWNYMGNYGHDGIQTINNAGGPTGKEWRNVIRLDGSGLTIKH